MASNGAEPWLGATLALFFVEAYGLARVLRTECGPGSESGRMKLVIFGLGFSPNLGDGVIADCLAHAVWERIPGIEVAALDLSGRDRFGAVTVSNRGLALAVLARLPRKLRHGLVRWRLTRMLDTLAPRWAAVLKNADAALIGGGQLFSDADLNFPLKIARAAHCARAADVPVAVHAVGVSRNWSTEGAALFAAVFAADLRRVGLRDGPSVQAWTDQMPGRLSAPPLPAPVIARDPGLLAAECYGPAPRRAGWVGLCVTDPALLGYHADGDVVGASAGGASGAGFYAALARALTRQGHRVVLFCNGAAEDLRALGSLAVPLADLITSGQVQIAEAPQRPADLARLIGGLDGLVAHRLHACILGYAYQRPVVGLGWDRKVESFFASVDAARFCVTDPASGADAVALVLQEALAVGISPSDHARARAEARQAIAAALDACGITPPGGS